MMPDQERPPDAKAALVPASERAPKAASEYRKAEKHIATDRNGKEYTLAISSMDASLAGQIEAETIEMLQSVEATVKNLPHAERKSFSEVIKSLPQLKLHAAKVLVAGMGARTVYWDGSKYVGVADYKNQLKALEIFQALLKDEREVSKQAKEQSADDETRAMQPEEFLKSSETTLAAMKEAVARVERARAEAQQIPADEPAA